MRHWSGARVSALLAAVTLALVPVRTMSQATQSAAKTPAAWQTPWGHPDLQGTWTTDAEISVLFERPAAFGERALLNDQELAKRETDTKKRARDNKEDRPQGPSLTTPAHWFEVGNASAVSVRTSLIVDPPNGRMPSLTAEGAKQAIDRRLETGLMPDDPNAPVNGPEDTGLAARCITRGIPETWIPSIYNNGFQIFQTPEYVAILYERYHEFRIIPLDARPHVGRPLGQWIGDSRGRWEGNTLVVDVTNFSGHARFKGSGENLHVVERLTRVDADTVNVAVTIEDPTRWTRPWRFEVNGKKDPRYRIFEMACHEGNVSMDHMLSAARNLEKGAAPEPP
jgi:hypothetical protein